MKIAILGSNGHIGQVLSDELSDLYPDLYARKEGYLSYDGLFDIEYDAIINCVGCTDVDIITKVPSIVYETIEEFDILMDQYQHHFKKCKVIHISSGSVFGRSMADPQSESSPMILYPNDIKQSDIYGITKFYCEMKHKFSLCNIIDIRLYGIFSRYQPLSAPYFMSEVVNSLLTGKELVVDNLNFVRDYISPLDFGQFVRCCLTNIEKGVFDTYTCLPASKFEILSYLAKVFDLEYRIEDTKNRSIFGGEKMRYYSINKQAFKIGYVPVNTTLKGLENEINIIIKNRNHGK